MMSPFFASSARYWRTSSSGIRVAAAISVSSCSPRLFRYLWIFCMSGTPGFMNDKTLAAGRFPRPAQFSALAQAVNDGGKVEREPAGERSRPLFQLFPVDGAAGIDWE